MQTMAEHSDMGTTPAYSEEGEMPSTSPDLVMRLVETDLMLQDPSIRVVACDTTLLH